MKKYYVYALLDPRKPGQFKYDGINVFFNYEPYYIGKGTKNRISGHFTESGLNESKNYNKIKYYKIKNIISAGFDPKIYFIIINNELTAESALELESNYIKKLGRIDLKTGILSNLTDGWDDNKQMSSCLKGKTYEELYGKEKADKLKEIRRKQCSGNKNPMYGKGHLLRGKHTMSLEGKKRLAESRKKKLKQMDLNCNVIKIWDSPTDAANYLGISNTAIYEVLSSRRNVTAAGFKWEYVDKKNKKYEC